MPDGTGKPPTLIAGQLLAERYRLDAPIDGGIGRVWSARDTVLDRPVTVKLITEAQAADQKAVSRFRVESRHAASLAHSGVAKVFDYGEQDGASLSCPYLVMEQVSGQPLSKLIASSGPMPPAMVLDITAQAARALQAAHDIGITHRHLNPSNLLVTEDGQVKVTDFGTAAVTPGPQIATVADAELIRAVAYMAPEQVKGNPASTSSDIYALGVIAYECLTGQLPFTGETARALAAARADGEPRPLPAAIPGPVRSLIMQMIAKDPPARPGNALGVAEAASYLRWRVPSGGGRGPGVSAAPPAPGSSATVTEQAGAAASAGAGFRAWAAAGTGAGFEAGPEPEAAPRFTSRPWPTTGSSPGVAPHPGEIVPAAGSGAGFTGEAVPAAGAGPGTDLVPAGPGGTGGLETMLAVPEPGFIPAEPQPSAAGARPRAPRRGPVLGVVAAVAAVIALGGTVAAMMQRYGGGPGSPSAQAHSSGAPVPGVLVPVNGTASPGKNGITGKPGKPGKPGSTSGSTKAGAGGGSAARPGGGSGGGPAASASRSPVGSPAPSPDPRPTLTWSPPPLPPPPSTPPPGRTHSPPQPH